MPTKLKGKTMARPRKSETEKFKKTISFRVNQKDFADFEGKRLAAGASKSAFYREHVARNTTQVIAAPSLTSDAKRAVFLLQKASNNLNQLAHRANVANRAGQLTDATFHALLDQLQQLNQFMLDQAGEAK